MMPQSSDERPAPVPQKWPQINPQIALLGAGGVVVLLAAGMFLKRKKRPKAKVTASAPPAIPSGGEPAKALPTPPETPAIAPENTERQTSAQGAKMERLVSSVKDAATEDPVLVAGVLRNWIEDR